MRKLQVAVIGLGRLGSACADFLLDESDLALAGIVRRPESSSALRGRLKRVASAQHVRDLAQVDVALVCVPTEAVAGVARELLQAHVPVVECALIEGDRREAYYAEVDGMAKGYRAPAVVGAGWDPGVYTLMSRAFDVLIPHGHKTFHRHPGVSVHHSGAVAQIAGVKDVLAGEYRGAEGVGQRYVYVELEPSADFQSVRSAILADPMFAGEETQVFQVASLADVEAQAGQGLVLERQETAAAGVHASLMLEARFDVHAFAARVMIDAARQVTNMRPGAHRYAVSA